MGAHIVPEYRGRTLVSISHWGVFDIAPFGAVIGFNRVSWQEHYQEIAEYPVDGRAFSEFIRPVFE